ncbi:vesicular glutamate transporter 1 [Elysia marginata]|uniref:Vesicular glutamate transporter 1 n=1 Tax=Elysia marginata TaxID=1093978 RepID=A0AAV4HB68_9GAST|nr:vesicular glutamate transporter 1 [Elysia marginata]
MESQTCNETDDGLAKEGWSKEHYEQPVTYREAKTTIKERTGGYWTKQDPLVRQNRSILPTLCNIRFGSVVSGFIIASGACLAVSFFDRENRWVAITFLTVTMFFQAVGTSHLTSIPMDIAPRYAGTVMSLTMSVALLLALSGPLAVSSLTPTGSYSEWRVVWCLMSAIFFSASLVFFIFGQASIQPWAAAVPEAVDSNRALEQPQTEMSMESVYVVEFSQEPGNLQGYSRHVISSEPVAQTSEYKNLELGAINNQECHAIPNHSHFNKSNYANQSEERSVFKIERDNQAFEKDLPLEEERENMASSNCLSTPTQCSELDSTQLAGLSRTDASTEQSNTGSSDNLSTQGKKPMALSAQDKMAIAESTRL